MPDNIRNMARASFDEQTNRFEGNVPKKLDFCQAIYRGRKIICRAKIIDT
jgi:hypothetical protein